MSDKQFVIKESTRKRCKIIPVNTEMLKKFKPISLELFHFLTEVKEINFCIYVRVGLEMIEYIRPQELSTELLKQIWFASQKEESDVEICILKKDSNKFDYVIDSVRKQKIANLLEKEPTLDRRVLDVFSDLSGASQMILRGGINSEIVEKASAAAVFMMTNLMDNDIAIGTLSRMINIDPTLYDHSASVAMFSGIIAKQSLGNHISNKEAIILAKCGLYHDAGKSCIPNAVLNKPGSFTPEEYEIMKTHADLGYKELTAAIAKGAPIDEVIATVALEHHERFLGHGYPHQKKGRKEENPEHGIHKYARIVAIADTYSALLMKRIYKPAMPAEQAIKVMCDIADKDFDPELFYPFIENIKKSLIITDEKRKAYKTGIIQINNNESAARAIKDAQLLDNK